MTMRLYEEPVTPTGGHKSEGVQNVLGRPPLNWSTVVLREAVQNSWDAREGNGSVDFDISWWTPSKDQKKALREQVFTEEPARAPIWKAIDKADFDVMLFADRGTRGLSGPVMANEEPIAGEKRNFVDFVWEIGRSEGAGPGGGTYGYGKTSFFRFSRIRAVCIYSRCIWNGRLEHRFIAAYLGHSSPKLTGRAWWGTVDKGSVRPLVGQIAADTAKAVGITPCTGDACGTSIMVLAPRMDDLPRDEAGDSHRAGERQTLQALSDSIVQWFWPKMVDTGSGAPMRFRIFHEGKEHQIPSPESVPPFNTYVEALSLLADSKKGKTLPAHAKGTRVVSLRPRANLGHLVMVKRAKKQRAAGSGLYGESSARELFSQARHVAFLRKPMLVVKYLEGPRPPSDQMDCAGIFVVDHEEFRGDVEKAFALSEPPTHDDWVPETLEDPHHRSYVRVALRRIKEAFAEFVLPPVTLINSTDQQPLGGFSESLGDLIAGSVDGTGPRIGPPGGGGGGGGGGAGSRKLFRIEPAGAPTLTTIDGIRCMTVPFRVVGRGASVTVRAIPTVQLEQGPEREPPEGAQVPAIHSFVRGDVVEAERKEDVRIPASKATDLWHVHVAIPDDTKVTVDLRVIDER